MIPRPTRRGQALAVTVVGALVMGWGFGGRSLNAVVMPAVAVLAIGFVTTLVAPTPRVERRAPGHGFAGSALRVELAVEADRSIPVTVVDRLGDLGPDPTFETVADGRPLSYEVSPERRGVYDLGPARVTTTDLFGLFESSATAAGTDELVAFPRVHELETTDLVSGYVGLTDEREEFAGLREYQQGDALRDVNWKASAKRNGDLVVTEFAGQGASEQVLLAVESGGDSEADVAAEAAASVAVHLLEAGLAVGVHTPTFRLDAGRGEAHRREVLSVLARYQGWGRAVSTDDADVVVRVPAGAEAATVEIDDRSRRFPELVAPEAETTAGDAEGVA